MEFTVSFASVEKKMREIARLNYALEEKLEELNKKEDSI